MRESLSGPAARLTRQLAGGLLAWGTLAGQAGAQPVPEEIVRPATGAGRAVYAPLDHAEILLRFVGEWSLRPELCAHHDPAGRLGLHQRMALIDGQIFPVEQALVMAPLQNAKNGDRPLRGRDFALTDDLLVGLAVPGSPDLRFIHFYLSADGTSIVVEEVGQPRRTYWRCAGNALDNNHR